MTLDETVAALKIAHAAECSAWAARDDIALDKRLAERSGDAAAIEDAESRMSINQSVWYMHYQEARRLREIAQKMLCNRYQLDDKAALFGH